MSYILDALRKSEEERRLAAGQGASLIAPTIVAPEQRNWLQPSLTATVVVLLLAGVAAWLWWRLDPLAPAQTAAPARRAPAAVLAASGSAATPAPAAISATPATAATPEKLGAAATAAPAANSARPTTAARPAGPAGADTADAGAFSPWPVAAPKAPAKPAAVATIAVRPPPPAAAPEKPAPAADAEPKNLPPLVIGGYLRDEQGASLAIINDKVVREGEEISPGLKLEKIREDGAQFNFNGQRFRR